MTLVIAVVGKERPTFATSFTVVELQLITLGQQFEVEKGNNSGVGGDICLHDDPEENKQETEDTTESPDVDEFPEEECKLDAPPEGGLLGEGS